MDNFFGPAGFGFTQGYGGPRGSFNEYYRCFSAAFLPGKERDSINYGSGIILPQSALAKLTQLNVETPYKFSLTNERTGKTTHGNVLEFLAEEGRAYVPRWMLESLGVQEGELVQIKSTRLPSGKFVKIQPQSTAFLDISDPKAVLERAFRSYLCMTLGDKIAFMYADREYVIEIQELKPANAVNLLDTDLEVDFAPPVGYVEPERKPTPSSAALAGSHTSIRDAVLQHVHVEKSGWDAIPAGQRLNGKALSAVSANHRTMVPREEVTPQLGHGDTPLPLRLPLGQLFFGFEGRPPKKGDGEDDQEAEESKWKGMGAGNVLRNKKGKSKKQ
ncbi:ubiquitin fusion degradation protein UFD1-domain-containing protein, partial [Catenaria anguillulae PL171]